MAVVRLILGDQLNLRHSWFRKTDAQVVYVMAEMRQETDYVKHHIQKVVGFFTAMRNFAQTLKEQGHEIAYFKINDPDNPQNLEALIQQAVNQYQATKLEYLLPDEYRLDQQLRDICARLRMESRAFDSEHFFTSRHELAEFFEGKKSFLMENFYRHMRTKHDVLMTAAGHPVGGKWNYDHSNRNRFSNELPVPKEKTFGTDVSLILEEIRLAGIETFGTIDAKHFDWPTSRAQSMETLQYFCVHLLRHFGDYQDAMRTEFKFLYHSRLSFAMNTKMISPQEVIRTVLNFYAKHPEIPIAEIEGYVRQVLGWREYMRGMYWKDMPAFGKNNVLGNHHALPSFYWNAQTKMNCLRHALGQSLDNAYAHHIQRLMVIGNFALLTQTDPNAVDAWYLGVYIDAIEWVEITNTRGMSQWADGGIIATKPYVSSGSYIHKMSNYCADCHYDHKDRLGEKACPFNALYWNFLDEKYGHFKDNPRMTMMLSLLDSMTPQERAKIKQKAQRLLKDVDAL